MPSLPSTRTDFVRLAALASALTVLALLVVSFTGEPGTERMEVVDAPPTAPPPITLRAPQVADSELAESIPSAGPATPRIEREAIVDDGAAMGALPSPGTISLVVSAPNAPDGFTFELRATTADRFATTVSASPCVVSLTAGEWEGSLLAAGYDPITLPPFVVREGERRDLGEYRFTTGTARLSGRVLPTVGVPSKADTAWIVDLYGPHVARCVDCAALSDSSAAPCPRCGAFDDRYRRILDSTLEFGFSNLLVGKYRLHAFRPGIDAAGIEEIFDLEKDGARFVQLIERARADLEIELVGADGNPFTGLLEENGELLRPQIRFRLDHDSGTSLTASFRASAPAGRGDPQRELLELAYSTFQGSVVYHATSFNVETSGNVPERTDRPRERGDQLHPPSMPGGPNEIGLSGAHTESPNRFRIQGVPCDRYRLVAACAQYSAEAKEVDLRLGGTVAVRCVMRDDIPPAMQALEIGFELPSEAGTLSLGANLIRISFDRSPEETTTEGSDGNR